ncbi:MAG: universal stress protein [Anaerolineales bacterium]|nr:universal stress protein [Anaerolineales bacterium]
MDKKQIHFLIITNSGNKNCPALDYGIWLAEPLKARVTILGIIEEPDSEKNIERLLRGTEKKLVAKGIEHQTLIIKGRTETIIQDVTRKIKADILVIGQLGRSRIRRWLRGRSFRHIMATVNLPILYIPEIRTPLKKILICLAVCRRA